MGMILDNNMNELMIDSVTGKLFKRELTREEKAYCILERDMGAEIKLAKLQDLGFEMEEILELALTFKD